MYEGRQSMPLGRQDAVVRSRELKGWLEGVADT